MKKVYIYGLFDVKDNIIRYVGKSVNPYKRFYSHKTEYKRKNNHKDCWIYSVLKNNSTIGYEILETCDETNWKEREIYWIKKLRETNRLVNYTDGGDGFQTNLFNKSYDELKQWIRENKPDWVTSLNKYHIWLKTKNIPTFLPIHPDSVYKFDGWISWGDYLSTSNKSSILISQQFLSYNDCKLWLKNNLSHINTITKFKEYSKLNNLPDFVPKNPLNAYKNKGWISNYDFFNKEKPEFLSYDDSKKWINNTFGNISRSEFKKLIKENKLPSFIPKKPDKTYNEFTTYKEYLGIRKYKTLENYLPFNDAKKIVHKLNIKTNKEWRIFRKTDDFKFLNIPSTPDLIYKDDWINWYDWLGTKKV